MSTASFICLMRFWSSLPTILKFSSEVVWPVMLQWSYIGEGCFRCSLNLSPKVLDDSPIYSSSHSTLVKFVSVDNTTCFGYVIFIFITFHDCSKTMKECQHTQVGWSVNEYEMILWPHLWSGDWEITAFHWIKAIGFVSADIDAFIVNNGNCTSRTVWSGQGYCTVSCRTHIHYYDFITLFNPCFS